MSYYFQKLFPNVDGAAFSNSFNIMVISEGYTSAEQGQFYQDAVNLWFKLMEFYPLSISANRAINISLYALFQASTNHGYAPSGPPTSGRTLFDSYYDSTNHKLIFDTTLVDTFLDNCFVTEDSTNYPVNSRLFKGTITASMYSTLVFVLLPASSTTSAEVEVIDTNHYYFIASSYDGYCEQILARTFGRLIGLGDEFELAGTNYAEPPLTPTPLGPVLNVTYPNLYYLYNSTTPPNPTTDTNFKWRNYFVNTYNTTLTMHPHTTGSLPDTSIPTVNVNYDSIQLWEGGGSYRGKVYRSAKDCLMRRQVGNVSLPTKALRVNFCPVCTKFLKDLLTN
ncbi:MAG: M64 family metallopeptidase [Flavipsychrobacter sp.]|nr:M64 family metallopeptidase [Flavipsychrobacter sp.]